MLTLGAGFLVTDLNINDSIRVTKDSHKTEDKEKKPEEPKQNVPMNAFDLFGSITQGVVTPLVSGDVQIRRETRFAVKGDLKGVTKDVEAGLKKLGANVTKKNDNEMKCFVQYNATLITFNVEIQTTSGGFSMVEVRRRKADILMFNELYRKLIKELGDVVVQGGLLFKNLQLFLVDDLVSRLCVIADAVSHQ